MRNGLSYSEAGKLGNIKSKSKRNERCKKIREAYENNPKRCKFCSEKISFENRWNSYCGHSCCASFNNKGVNRYVKVKMEENGLDINKPQDIRYYFDHIRKPNNCLFCGKAINFRNVKFCNSKCCSNYNWKILKEKIKNQNGVNFNPIGNSKTAKRYLKEVRGAKCEICGITKWMSKDVPLVLDHINGNSMDWRLDNLRIICGNCDIQTSTYKGKNMGKGRFFRRMRYKAGKSY